MGKKYMDTREGTLESSILDVWKNAADLQEKGMPPWLDKDKKKDESKTKSETNKNDKSDDGEGLDAVQPKAVKKKFDNRKDKDIDNDGDTDDSDEYLHKKRKAISKKIGESWMEAVVDQISRSERAQMFSEKGMPPWLDKDKEKDEGNKFGMALKAAKDKGDKTFVVSGKKYDVKTEEEIPSKGAKKTETGKTAAKVEINPEIEDRK